MYVEGTRDAKWVGGGTRGEAEVVWDAGLTCDACAVAEVDRVPHHRPVGDGEESLGILVGIARKCGERGAGTAENQGLQPRRSHRGGVWHDVGGLSAGRYRFTLRRGNGAVVCSAQGVVCSSVRRERPPWRGSLVSVDLSPKYSPLKSHPLWRGIPPNN